MRFDRLLALYDHLMHGKLAHRQFDFGVYNRNGRPGEDDGPPPRGKCGTLGCAIGEMPAVDPAAWKWDGDAAVLRDPGFVSIMESGVEYFCISEGAFAHLFIPGSQRTDLYSGVDLDGNASRYEVASNIAAFIERWIENVEDTTP